MKNVVCFGELMLSLCPRGCFRFIQVDEVEFIFTGAEANAAASLAQFGMDFNLVSVDQTANLMNGDGSGRVQR